MAEHKSEVIFEILDNSLLYFIKHTCTFKFGKTFTTSDYLISHVEKSHMNIQNVARNSLNQVI